VVSLFPESFDFLKDKGKSGLVGRAFEDGKLEFFISDLRQFGEGKHQVVDDMPYGGGDGMVLKPAPLKSAIDELIGEMKCGPQNVKIVFMTPAGNLWNQSRAENWAEHMETSGDGLILVCGRYAGFDQRIIEHYKGSEISIGPFILNGGELPALCVIESLVRLLPGVLGNSDSALKDSFSKGTEGRIEAPSYTRPQEWEGLRVPEVLTAGNHKDVDVYRNEASIKRTDEWVRDAKKTLFSNEEQTKN
jgi:tRNA (guanine37-N1)-methyltransferase